MNYRLVCSVLAGLCLLLPGTHAAAQDAEQEPTAETAEPYRVGAVISLSGPLASLGQAKANTLSLVADQVAAQGGVVGPDGERHPLELILYDDAASPDLARQVAELLIVEHEVALLIAGPGSANSLALAEVAEQHQIPLISLAGASTLVDESPESQRFWVFKTTHQAAQTFTALAGYLKARGVERVASLEIDDLYGTDSASAMRAVFADASIDVVYDEAFPPGTEDFSGSLENILASDAEALVFHATSIPAAAVTRQLAALDAGLLLIQTPGVGNQTFLALAGDAANGVIVPISKLLVAAQLPVDDPQRPVLLAFADQYSEAFGEPVSTFGGHAWDAMHLALVALQAVGPDGPALRDYLESEIDEWVGVTGIYTMSPEDHSGLDTRGLVIVEVVDGEWRYVAPGEQ